MNKNENITKKELCDKIRQMKQERITLQQKCHALKNNNKFLKQQNNFLAAKCCELERDNISKNKKYFDQKEEFEDKVVILNKIISSKDNEILLATNNTKIFENDCESISKKADLLIKRCDMLQKGNDDKQEIIDKLSQKATKYEKETHRCYEIIKKHEKKINYLKMKLSENDNDNNNKDKNEDDDDDDDDDMNIVTNINDDNL